jgi:polyisoprenoid-binding protein YceI
MKRAVAGMLWLACTAAWAAAPCWRLDDSRGSVRFSGEQAGAPAQGHFADFSLQLCFDPAQAHGELEVGVELKSLDTGNDARDDTLRGSEFFDVARHPRAVYRADRFEPLGGGRFRARGALTLHGVTRPLPLEFTFGDAGGRAQANGSASLDRREFGVGQGRWGDTRWVGSTVQVRFDVTLVPVQ